MWKSVRDMLDQCYQYTFAMLNSEHQRNPSKELVRTNNFKALTLVTFLEAYLLSALLTIMCDVV